MLRSPLIGVIAAIPACAQPLERGAEDEMRTPNPGEVMTVGGAAEVEVARDGEYYRAGQVFTNTALPLGYPRPTAPGAIEVKTYPEVRRAEFHQDGPPSPLSPQMGFWPLFQHIKSRDIAMTTPVETDYPGLRGGAREMPDSWTMSFLYRSRDLGPVGEFGPVSVRDLPPLTVVALGYMGPYSLEWSTLKLAELESWLDSQDEWERAGDARVLHYNGPSVPVHRRWAEVQIPVRPVGASTPAGAGTGE